MTRSSFSTIFLNPNLHDQILNFVRYTIQTRKVNLLVIDQLKRNKQTYTLFVDSKLTEFTVSVSGNNPQVILIDPARSYFLRVKSID